jgi:hypothetical protein
MADRRRRRTAISRRRLVAAEPCEVVPQALDGLGVVVTGAGRSAHDRRRQRTVARQRKTEFDDRRAST